LIVVLRAGQIDAAVELLQGVELLNLNDQSLRGDIVRTLEAVLRLNSSVMALHLSHTQLGGVDAAAILDALHTRNVKVGVSLSDNALCDQDCLPLGAAIARNGAVTQIYLTNNNIQVAGVFALRAGIERSIVLTDVVFGFQGLTDGAVMEGNPFHDFAEGLEHECQINSATRENRQLRDGRGLRNNPALERTQKLGVYPEADIQKLINDNRTSASSCVVA
jgi:hypothetical protein